MITFITPDQKHRVTIDMDPNPGSFDFDPGSCSLKIALFHRHYCLENTDEITMSQAEAIEKSSEYTHMGVWGLARSDLTLLTYPPHGRWDGSKLGILYANNAEFKAEYPDADIKETLTILCDSYVKTFNKWNNSGVQSVQIETVNTEDPWNPTVEYCGGFWCTESILEYLEDRNITAPEEVITSSEWNAIND